MEKLQFSIAQEENHNLSLSCRLKDYAKDTLFTFLSQLICLNSEYYTVINTHTLCYTLYITKVY